MKAKILLCSVIGIALFSLYLKTNTTLLPSINNVALVPNSNKLNRNSKSEVITPSKMVNEESSNIACSHYLLPIDDNDSWKKNKQALIKRFFLNLKSNTGEKVLDSIAVKSGVGLYRGRGFRTPLVHAYTTPAFDDGYSSFASIEERELIAEIVKTNNYEKLNKAINSGDIRNNIYLLGEREFLPLFSYLVLTATNKSIKAAEELIQYNIKLTYFDLVIATDMNFPLPLIKQLYNASNLQADKRLNNYNHYTSLAMIALKANALELFTYWVSQGSSLQPDDFSANALDIVVNSYDVLNKETFLSLFKQINTQQFVPNTLGIHEKLMGLLPKDELLIYQKKYNAAEVLFSKQQKLLVKQKVEQLYSQILKNSVDVIVEKNPAHKCFSKLSRHLIEKTFTEELVKKEQPKLPLKKEKTEVLPQMVFNSEEEIKEKYNFENTLESKQAIHLYRQNKMIEALTALQKESTENIDNKEIKETIQATIAEVFKLAHQQQWEQAIQLVEQLDLDLKKEEIYTSLLIAAINSNADFTLIQDFIEQGAILLPNTIYQLVLTDNAVLAYKLLPYGLSLEYINPMNYSILTIAVQHKALSMVNFLIAQNVEIKTSDGYDALDIALLQLGVNSSDLTYVSLLISAGAQIGTSHKQITNKLKYDSFDIYIQLISKHPELLINNE